MRAFAHRHQDGTSLDEDTFDPFNGTSTLLLALTATTATAPFAAVLASA
jgi:hypothetical protein